MEQFMSLMSATCLIIGLCLLVFSKKEKSETNSQSFIFGVSHTLLFVALSAITFSFFPYILKGNGLASVVVLAFSAMIITFKSLIFYVKSDYKKSGNYHFWLIINFLITGCSWIVLNFVLK